jgi:hypothetical protein
MPDTRWFAGVTVNYADALLAGRGAAADVPAIIATTEAGDDRVITRGELRWRGRPRRRRARPATASAPATPSRRSSPTCRRQ